ncbi:conserved hypothetical protein [Methylocella silvestris BL2]|uniref:Uncharacterized protein n=1 Tax=Methylocella silvestris (strain DSM 15510 / CIP 108128 / LMG 27833 / NCIMB 13906 / BL2) TaxID=395965 RepID=B8EQS0_METSB|nr:hypothetical protein [Methylocella silvestris]ACK49341.1 conserved hypothetical protein [Methylocella silvestris BL2]
MGFGSRPLVTPSLVFAVFIAGASSGDALGEPSLRAGPHDGVYAVEIHTRTGGCDPVYRWTITVSAGRVSSPVDGFMQASGKINAQGGVSLAFRRDNQVANVAGKVKGRLASGTWSSPTLQCAGFWSAVRSG